MLDFLHTFFAQPAKHWINLATKPEYRQYHRLRSRYRSFPRFIPIQVSLDGWKVEAPDAASFLSMYREIFLNQVYAFRFEHASPRILDMGANIGLSVLYFKQRFPAAVITTFEADRDIFTYLERNLLQNGITDVELINRAAWNSTGRLRFFAEGADAGYILQPEAESPTMRERSLHRQVEVEAEDMRLFLRDRCYDFIKMDIEGAEHIVLPACHEALQTARYVFVEFHSRVGEPQRFAEIVSLLAELGFRLEVKEVWGSSSPLLERRVNPEGFDFQANIFGWREVGELEGSIG
jgi:FkbM family methyltransferase